MAVYAAASDLASYLAGIDSDLRPPTGAAAVEALLTAAEQDVDRVCGAYPKLPTGLVFAPALLTLPQQDALRRATCAAAEFRIASGDEVIGASEFLSGNLQLAWRGPRPPGQRVLEELAGYGLIRRSGCAAPTPLPLLPLFPPWP